MSPIPTPFEGFNRGKIATLLQPLEFKAFPIDILWKYYLHWLFEGSSLGSPFLAPFKFLCFSPDFAVTASRILYIC